MTFQINGTSGVNGVAINSTNANAGSFSTINLSAGILSTTIGQNLNFLSSDTNLLQLDTAGNVKLQVESGTLQTASGKSFSPYNLKNKIINGNFDIWQRGTTQTTSMYGSDDRWANISVGSTKVHSRQAFTLGQTAVPNNPKYYSRTVVTSVAGANNLVAKAHHIEGVAKSSGKTMTLSFWAKADANKNIIAMWTQNFGTGGTPSGAVSVYENVVSLTASWQKFTMTVDFPSVAGKNLGTNNNDYYGIGFWFDQGSNFGNAIGQQSGTFDIAQVQLEEGSVATEFEDRPIGYELLLCQRYYEVMGGAVNALWGASYGAGVGNGGTRFPLTFKAIKQQNPTIAVQGTWLVTNVSQPVAQNIRTRGFYLTGTSTGTAVPCGFYCNSTDDLITIDAEI